MSHAFCYLLVWGVQTQKERQGGFGGEEEGCGCALEQEEQGGTSLAGCAPPCQREDLMPYMDAAVTTSDEQQE